MLIVSLMEAVVIIDEGVYNCIVPTFAIALSVSCPSIKELENGSI